MIHPKVFLRQANFKPSKGLGQNFLISRTILEKIIKTAELQREDIILEIGPGLGVLTLTMAAKVKKVVAVEKDHKMTELLSNVLMTNQINNVEVIQKDILKFEIRNSKSETNPKSKILNSKFSYKIIANLPYYITNPVIMKFLEAKNPPKLMVLMTQKEVTQRICSRPPKMNKLAIFCQFLSQPKIIAYVSRKSFWPQPKVDSAILLLKPLINTNTKLINTNKKLFAKIVKAGFSQPRKQLLNNLSKGLDLTKEQTSQWLLANNISPTQRAQTLSVENWLDLTKSFSMLK